MITGGIIADVGSDHAYLPIWLRQNGKIKKAYALDISANSIKKINRNLRKYNIPEDIITPVLSDGLSGLENLRGITDIVIAGMGGENISRIIKSIEESEIKNINFILQPNTKVEFLRGFLYKNGFDITDEIIAEDETRLYNIIRAAFTGICYEPKPIEIIAGKNIKHAGYINKIVGRLHEILIDLDEKGEKKYSIKTELGYYKDIENLISELKNYD